MTIEEAIKLVKEVAGMPLDWDDAHYDALQIAIKSLEMQKKLAEFSGMDICNLVADYDYDNDENISEYVYEADVDDFLIDEINDEMEEESNI